MRTETVEIYSDISNAAVRVPVALINHIGSARSLRCGGSVTRYRNNK